MFNGLLLLKKKLLVDSMKVAAADDEETAEFVLRKSTISFRDCNLLVSSLAWALSTEFSASMDRYCWVVRLTVARIFWFSFLSWATWATRSSRCFCFLSLDLLADSRFDIILFLFLWSIKTCRSSSEPEFRIRDDDPDDVPLDEAMEMEISRRKNRGNDWRLQFLTQDPNTNKIKTEIQKNKMQKIVSTIRLILIKQSWDVVEPVKEGNGEGLNKMGPAPDSGIYHTTRKEDFTENWIHESQTSRS